MISLNNTQTHVIPVKTGIQFKIKWIPNQVGNDRSTNKRFKFLLLNISFTPQLIN